MAAPALAYALLRDNAAADDVAQDAWLVAAERAPRDGRPLRPWLHRVVVNLVRMRGRGAERRRAREVAIGDTAPGVPTSEELVERVETQRALASEVLALTEPYRSTVLLHYVEGLSSAEIARRLGLNDATVRQRLKHALDDLRSRLRARDDGPKRGWLVALAPLARSHALGAVTMKKATALVIALILALLVGGGVAWRLHARSADSTAGDDGSAGDHIAGRVRALDRGREPLALRGNALPAWFGQAGVAPRRIAGHVTFAGAAVAGATVRLGANMGGHGVHPISDLGAPALFPIATVTTSADGAFDFGPQPAAGFVVSAEADGKAPHSIGLSLSDPRAAPPPEQLVIALGDCSERMFGVVRDVASPIAAARVQVAGLGGTTADASGHYSVCLPSANNHNIRVIADGYGTIFVNVPTMLGDLHHDFVLVPEATVAGSVVDGGGRPVAGASVIAAPRLSEGTHGVAPMVALSDGDGRFSIPGVAPGFYSLRARSDRAVTLTSVVIPVTAGVATRDVRLVVTGRSRITGKVMIAGVPVAGARVATSPDFSGRANTPNADTQPDGSFVLDEVPRGTVTLAVWPYEVRSPAPIVVDRDDITGVVIEVASKASVRGVVTRHHVPVAGALIVAPNNDAIGAVSDGSGAYVLEGLPAGTIELYANDRKAFTKHTVTLATGQALQLDLELESGGEVRGTVVDETGAVVPSVLVVFDSSDNDDHCNALTDANGAFDCATLLGGMDYRPTVFPTPAQQRPFRSADGDRLALVHVDDGDAVVTDVRLAIKLERLEIRGKVVDDTGTPIVDVHVTAGGEVAGFGGLYARTDSDGAFTVQDLAPGRYNLRAHASDGSEAEVTGVDTGATNVVIAVARPGRIEGTLVGFATPPRVYAESPLLDLGDSHEAVVTGDRFAFPAMPVGSYAVDAMVDGVQIDGASADVRPGGVVHLTLRSRSRTTVEGRITDRATGAPLAGMSCAATISIDGSEGPLLGALATEQTSDAAGHFSVDASIGHDRVRCMSPTTHYSDGGGDFDIAGPTHVELVAIAQVPPPSNVGFVLAPWTIPATVLAVDPAVGLATGDQLVTLDGAPIAGLLPSAVMMLAQNHRPGTTLALGIVRGGAPIAVKLVARE